MLTHQRGPSLKLTAPERADLEAIVASRSLPHGLMRRANMVLLHSHRRRGMWSGCT